MKSSYEKLWDELGPRGIACPAAHCADINQRVGAALDADPSERRRNMRHKFRMAAVLAAALLSLAGTALAIYQHYTALDFFNGDTALIEPAVQPFDATLENESYRIRVDSILADSNQTVLGLCVEALTEEARLALDDAGFLLTSVLRITPEIKGGRSICLSSTALQPEGTATPHSFSVHLRGAGAPNTLRLYFKDGSPDGGIALSLEKPLEGLSIESGLPLEGREQVVRSCTLNAIGISLDVQFARPVNGNRIVEFCFRMADGSLKTLSQLNDKATSFDSIQSIESEDALTFRYSSTFRTPIDPTSVTGVLMNGMEYSFPDPESATPAEIPATMRPFLTPYLERNGSRYFSASDVCHHIGAALERDGQVFTIRYLEHVLTLSPGKSGGMRDGTQLPAAFAPVLEGDDLLLSSDLFQPLGLCGSMYYPDGSGPAHAPDSWLVTP